MRAQRSHDPGHLGGSARLQASNVRHDKTAESMDVDMLETGLETSDVFLDLLDEGQMIRQVLQPFIWFDAGAFDRRGTGRHKRGVKCIVLRPPQTHPRIGADLDRLQYQHLKARRTQMPDHAALVATGRLDPDALDADFDKLRRTNVSSHVLYYRTASERSCRESRCQVCPWPYRCRPSCANLRHLHRPLPCEANQVVPATIRVR